MRDLLIFGDSYSTFCGHIPNNFASYYPKLDVDDVEKTWWKNYIQKSNSRLIQNNSWSGSTIGYTGYNNSDCSKSSSFIYRYKKLKEEDFFVKNNVDSIFVFGGTNDSWADAPLGELKFANWEEKDLFYVLPAISYFAYLLKADLPNAKIIFIINTDIKEEIQEALEIVANYYGLQSVSLKSIDKENGHPTKKGMIDICDQLLKSLCCI